MRMEAPTKIEYKGNRQTPSYGDDCNNKYDDNGIKKKIHNAPIPQLPYTDREEKFNTRFIQLNRFLNILTKETINERAKKKEL